MSSAAGLIELSDEDEGCSFDIIINGAKSPVTKIPSCVDIISLKKDRVSPASGCIAQGVPRSRQAGNNRESERGARGRDIEEFGGSG